MSKQQIIDERRANLPIPDQPPTASDWNSADERTVNVGSGGGAEGIAHPHGAGASASSLRGPSTGESNVRIDSESWKTHTAGSEVGRQSKDNLGGIPNDAVTRDAKNKQGTVDTTGEDYGYPHKSDPSSGFK